MNGTLHIIPPDASKPKQTRSLKRLPSLIELQRELGGPVRPILHFDTYRKNGEVRSCRAYQAVNQNQVNQEANVLLFESCSRKLGHKTPVNIPTISGPIIVVTGDREFMDSL